MQIKRLKKQAKHFHNFTGLKVEEFETLLDAVKKELEKEKETPTRTRQRAVGGGRKPALEIEEQLLVLLMYYRLYVTQLLLGYLFDLDDSNVSRLIGRLRPILLEVLPLPARERGLFNEREKGEKRIARLDELLGKHPEIQELLIDATEQEIQKPKDKQKRKDNYSGKQKRHTLKTQIASSKSGLVLHKTDALPGKIHDVTVLRGTGVIPEIPDGFRVIVDKGYDGAQNDFPDTDFYQPYKARRNKPLDFIQKCLNQIQTKHRIPVEHVLGHLQKFKILAAVYRGGRGNHSAYDDTFSIITGLHNFKKLDSLSW